MDCVKLKYGVCEIVNYIKTSNPSAISINIFTQNFNLVKEIVSGVDGIDQIFIGGQVVKSIYNDILDWNIHSKMYVIVGDGELIIPSIFENRCTEEPKYICGNKKVYWVNSKSLYFPSNLDEQRIDRKFIPNETIINHYGQEEASIVTSRGCIYNCAFCGGARSLNRDVDIRFRSNKNIILEIEELIYNYPQISSIRILDDLFLRDIINFKNAIEIFNYFPKITWRGMAHTLSFPNTFDYLFKLHESGCKEIFIGIESGSMRVRKRINKVGEVVILEDTIKQIMLAGIDVKGYIIYGFPDESLEDFKATYNLVLRLKSYENISSAKFRTSVFQFRPYHGTQLFNEIIRKCGTIHDIRKNCSLNESMNRRTQFNFQSGNYSCESELILTEYFKDTKSIKLDKEGIVWKEDISAFAD